MTITVRSTISQTGKVASITTLFSRAKQIIIRNRKSIGLVIKATKFPQKMSIVNLSHTGTRLTIVKGVEPDDVRRPLEDVVDAISVPLKGVQYLHLTAPENKCHVQMSHSSN